MSTDPFNVLMIDKVLLSPYLKEPRGVEVFNLNLLKDLAEQGQRITAAVHETWKPVVKEWIPGDSIEWISPSANTGDLRAAFCLASQLGGRRFSALLLANVANRLVPLLLLLRLKKVAPRCVLIAHREPSRRSLWVQKLWTSTIVAVNRQIAGHFIGMGFPRVAVRYGITHADSFHPASRIADKAGVDFCVTGHLDSGWKGADTAMAAFRMLPEECRRRCRLHLASFHHPPTHSEPNVIAYSWMEFRQMPDFIRRMDVMLVPSRDEEVMRETFSQAMVQGMLTGLPLIVNDLPVLKEKLDQGGGLVFRTVHELAAAMERLARDSDLRRTMGEQARRTALERYVWDTAAFVRDFLAPQEGV